MGAAAIPLFAIGTGLQAYGQYRAGKEAERAAKDNAAAALEEGRLREQEQGKIDRQTMSRARAITGDSAVAVGEGSPLDVQAEMMRQAEQNAYIIRRHAELEAAGYRAQGQAAKTSGYLGALGTVIGAASDYAGTRYRPSRSGNGGSSYAEAPPTWDLG